MKLHSGHVEIDDLLTEGEDQDEAINTFRKVLERCWEKNIKLARHKLEAGPEVNFAGTHIGGPNRYCLTQAKIDAIINLPAPTNINELRLFIRCWNQMRNYLPDFNHSLVNINRLLKKDTPYIWDQEMQKEFEKIK